MKRAIVCILALLLFSCSFALGESSGEQYAFVNNPNQEDRLNLRREPKADGESLGKYFNGTIVRLLGSEGEWCHVQIGSGAGSVTGYMKRAFLALPGEKHNPAFTTPTVNLAVVGQMEEQYIYGSAENGSPMIASLPAYTPVTVLGICNDLAHIQFGGITAFVDANAVYMGERPVNLQSATLRLNHEGITLYNQEKLGTLNRLLSDATPMGYRMSDCPFTAALILYTDIGTTIEIQLATDACCVFRYNGYDYRYAGHANIELFSLFGLKAIGYVTKEDSL